MLKVYIKKLEYVSIRSAIRYRYWCLVKEDEHGNKRYRAYFDYARVKQQLRLFKENEVLPSNWDCIENFRIESWQ